MSKTSRTEKMTKLLESHFDLCNINLKEEMRCNSGQKKCDLAGLEYHNGEPYCSVGIEIKQSDYDFKTGNGLNFTFDVNYLCVPSELVGYALEYLDEKDLYEVGLIEYRDFIKQRKPRLHLIRSPHYNFNFCINRNDCLLDKNTFRTLRDIPESAYSF